MGALIRFFCIFFLCWAMLFGSVFFDVLQKNVICGYESITGNLTDTVSVYNRALFLAKNGDYRSAKSLLEERVLREDVAFGNRAYELYGDILYTLKNPSALFLPSWKKAYGLNPNTRLEQKIAFFEQAPPVDESGEGEKRKESDTSPPEQQALSGILQDQMRRAEFLNPYYATQQESSAALSGFKEFSESENFNEEKDW